MSFVDNESQDSSDAESVDSDTEQPVSESDGYYRTRSGRRVIPREILDL